MDQPLTAPPLPAAYYRHHAARVRQLARQAVATGIREHLDNVALQYDLLAERVESIPWRGRG